MWLPGLWKIIRWRTDVLWHRGDFAGATRAASRYVRFRPGDPFGWLALGEAQLHEHDYQEAERTLREGVRRHPDYPWLSNYLEFALHTLGHDDEARGVIEDQIRRTPGSPIPYIALVAIATRAGEWDAVRRHADEAIARMGPGDVREKFELAGKLVVADELEDAERLLREVEQTPGPHLPMSHATLAVLVEDRDAVAAREYEHLARREWVSPHDIESYLDSTRELLRIARKERAEGRR
jgi:tetratricopeptide (TPR) repeat protein